MEQGKCYIGIDPGQKGFITTQYNGVWAHYAIADNDFYQLSRILREIKEKHANSGISCVIEDVHAIFGSSAKSTFSFGEIVGLLRGLLIANDIPYVAIQPKTWQMEMWGNQDVVASYKKVRIKDKDVTKKVVDTKATSINACKRLFPTFDLRKTDRCKNIDDNKVDSILLCEYARRKNL